MELEELSTIISDVLSVDTGTITLNSKFVEDLGADSLDIVELIMALEEELEMEIPDEDAEGFKTVGDVVEYITEHTEK